jgi:hypothetical protein
MQAIQSGFYLSHDKIFEIISNIDYGGSWSLFTRLLAKNFYLIQLLQTTHLIEFLDRLNRAQLSGK